MLKKQMLILLSALIIFSCQEPDLQKENSNDKVDLLQFILSGGSGGSYDGEFISVASRNQTGTAVEPWYALGASFYTSSNLLNEYDAGTVTIADATGFTYDPNARHGNTYGHNYKPLTSNIPTFGANASFAITGNASNSFTAFTTSMYCPEELELTTNFVDRTVDGTQGLTLTWNADANNSNDVYLWLNYLEIPSNDRDSNMPDNTISLNYTFPDNGSYTVPTSVLQQLPDGSLFTLYIGRGNIKYHTDNGKTYQITSGSYVAYELNMNY